MRPHPAHLQLSSPLPFTSAFAHWEENPIGSFENWMSEHGFSKDTADVYRYMWAKLIRWMSAQGLSMEALRSIDLQSFLDDAGLEKHHRYRYVRLVERIYARLAQFRPGLENPGSKAAIEKVGRGMNAPTAFLDKQQRDQLIRWLSRSEYHEREATWKDIRDRAITGAILGGGLKGAEVRRMSVSNILTGGWLEVWGVSGRHHRTRLATFAQALLANWVKARREVGTPGKLLFPSTMAGAKMVRMTLYRIVHRQLAAAGIALEAREAPQTLRNTFAAMMFDAGESDAMVTEYMGLQEISSATRMRVNYQTGVNA